MNNVCIDFEEDLMRVLVYNQNLISVLATKTKIRFLYLSVSEPKLFLPKPKLPPFFSTNFSHASFEYFPGHTELSCKTFSNYLSICNFHWLVCII